MGNDILPIHKNTLKSFGLTLVTGLPFPHKISANVARFQADLEGVLPDLFAWYAPEHLHVTLSALLRGRYRSQPPIQRDELPADFLQYVHNLAAFLESIRPFSIEFGQWLVTKEGLLLAKATCSRSIREDLDAIKNKYLGFDPTEKGNDLHMTVGYVKPERYYQVMDNRGKIEMVAGESAALSAGRIWVDHVWLVHYSNRTLNQVVGKMCFPVGSPKAISQFNIFSELGINPG